MQSIRKRACANGWLAVLVSIFLSAACFGQIGTATRKLPTIPYQEYRLKNGLQVILSEDHTLPLVAVNLWYHVGPANEKAGGTGFAHLFEHMMFEGSQHVGSKAHFAYLEAAGATEINGTTDFDRTNYFETVPSNQLELALWLESDRMGYLTGKLDIQNLANQRDVVRNERRQSVENSPYGLVEEDLYHLLFPKDHPYYPNVIGSHADVEAAKLEDVRQFFAQYYIPNNATLVIAGDFDKSTVRELVQKYFGTIPEGLAVPKVAVDTPAITSQRRDVVTDEVKLPRLYIGWITPPVFKPGDAECGLFSLILAGGKSSRLYKSLVYEKEIAQDASASVTETRLGSILELQVTAKPGVKLEDLEKAVDTEMDKLRKDGPTAVEVERARNIIETSIVRSLQSTGGVANRLNYYNQYAGTPDYFSKDLARYDAATPLDIKQVIETVFARNGSVVVYGVPGKKKIVDVPKTSDEENKRQAVQAGANKNAMLEETWRAMPPPPGPAPKFTLPVPLEFKLANGLTVLLVERHNLPIVAASLFSMSGSELNPVSKPGLSSFTANMLPEGTTSRSAVRFAEDTDQIGASLSSEASYSSAYQTLFALTWNVGMGFDLLADEALHPAFDAKEIERVRSRRVTAVLQENDDPSTLGFRTVYQMLYPGSPYGFSVLGTEASNKNITRENMLTFWKQAYVPTNAVLAVSGDLTEGQLKEFANKYFGAWSGPAFMTKAPKTPAAPERAVFIVDKPGSPQTFLAVAGLGASRNTADYIPLEVMNNVLGGLFSSRINMNLREQHGYTYGAFSTFEYRRGVGPFTAGGGIRTDSTAPAADEILKELGRIRESEVTADELKRSKDAFSKSLVKNFDTAENVSSTIGLQFVFGLPLDYYRNLPAQIEVVTSADTLRVARDYLHPEHVIVVAVGDREKIEPGLKESHIGEVQNVLLGSSPGTNSPR